MSEAVHVPVASAVPPASRPATAWTWATYAWALVVGLGVGYFLVRGPLQVSDNVGNLVKLLNSSLTDLLRSELGGGPYMRPGLWAMFKLAFDFSGGAYHATYVFLHAAQVVVLALLFARLLAVRTPAQFLLVPVAFSVLVGMHTFGGFVLEAYPINTFTTIAIYVLAVLNLTESRGGWWADAGATAILLLAMFTLETGGLAWVALVTAFAAGARGVSWRGVAGASAVVAAYVVFRFVLVSGGTPGLEERSSGYGFAVLDPEQLVERFGSNPMTFYLYNIASSLASVLFAEPRAGVWEFTRTLTQSADPPQPWMAINVATSVATSLVLLAYSLRRVPRWLRLRVEPRERLVVVFWGVAAANAVISFPYTKDQIIAVAGCLYAAAAFVALLDLTQQRWAARSWLTAPIAALVLLLLSGGWTIRAAGLHYNLTLAAYRHRNDWLEVREWMADQRIELGTSSHALVEQLERESLQMRVPHPFLVYGRFGGRYFDQH